jgi:hypothetical protein
MLYEQGVVIVYISLKNLKRRRGLESLSKRSRNFNYLKKVINKMNLRTKRTFKILRKLMFTYYRVTNVGNYVINMPIKK